VVKAPDFDSGMRRFESFHPCQNTVLSVFPAQRTAQASRKIFAICKERPRLLGAVLFFLADEKKISRLRMRFASKIFCVVIRARTHFSEGKNDF
jgi:hypothetical protein